MFGVAAEGVSFVDLLGAGCIGEPTVDAARRLQVVGPRSASTTARSPGWRDLLGLALRRNPRRAHLLVSPVLGKHMPTDPRVVHAAGLLLGALVADAWRTAARAPLPVDLLHAAVPGRTRRRGRRCTRRRGAAIAPSAVDAVVLGFAETATGARALRRRGARRRRLPALHPAPGRRRRRRAARFDEEHSHATGHLLLPADPALLAGPARWCWSTTSSPPAAPR